MSWLSDWLQRQGGVGRAINAVGGPLVNAGGAIGRQIPGVGTAIGVGQAIGNMIPGRGGQQNQQGQPDGDDPGFQLPAGLTWGDILRASGAVAGGISQSNQANANRNQNADQFNRTIGLQAGDRAAALDDRIQRAPMRDRAQYLAQNRAAPTPFQPRDFTRGGFGVMNSQAQGGPTQQLQANANAAANYRPGAGGYDTSTLEMLRRRMLQQAGV